MHMFFDTVYGRLIYAISPCDPAFNSRLFKVGFKGRVFITRWWAIPPLIEEILAILTTRKMSLVDHLWTARTDFIPESFLISKLQNRRF